MNADISREKKHFFICHTVIMAPRTWASTEQQLWLESNMAVYLEHKASCTLNQFWPEMYRRWFLKFVEVHDIEGGLTAEQVAALKKTHLVSYFFGTAATCCAHIVGLADSALVSLSRGAAGIGTGKMRRKRRMFGRIDGPIFCFNNIPKEEVVKILMKKLPLCLLTPI